jgi:hypothetical protein
MYEIIKQLQPYFYSLREVNDDVSLDIKLPVKWVYKNVVPQFPGMQIMDQDGNQTFKLISLISKSNEEGYNTVISCAMKIIEVNKEEEQKQELFSNMVSKLKELFENESLDKIKEISFLNNVNTPNSERIRLASERDQEGQ